MRRSIRDRLASAALVLVVLVAFVRFGAVARATYDPLTLKGQYSLLGNLTTGITCANNTNTISNTYAVNFDNGTWYAGGAPSRFTAPTTGTFVVSYNFVWGRTAGTSDTGVRSVLLYKNGSVIMRCDGSANGANTSGSSSSESLSTVLALTSGDYLELGGFQNSTNSTGWASGVSSSQPTWVSFGLVVGQ